MTTSDEQAHADAWLDAKDESDPARTRSRICEGCNQRVLYGRLTWDAPYDRQTRIGHLPSCKALSLWAVLEANGATTWEEPSSGGGNTPLTWDVAGVTWNTAVTWGTATI